MDAPIKDAFPADNLLDANSLLIKIANEIDLSWFEWSIRLGIAAIIFLCFKELVTSVFYYLVLRLDKHIGIGTVVKFGNNVYGKILDYNMRKISIIMQDGIVKIPLSVWLNTYYTQVTVQDIDILNLQSFNEIGPHLTRQDEKLKYLYDELCDLKTIIHSNSDKKDQDNS